MVTSRDCRVRVPVRTAEIEGETLSDAKGRPNSHFPIWRTTPCVLVKSSGKPALQFTSAKVKKHHRQPDLRMPPRRKVIFYGLATVTPRLRALVPVERVLALSKRVLADTPR